MQLAVCDGTVLKTPGEPEMFIRGFSLLTLVFSLLLSYPTATVHADADPLQPGIDLLNIHFNCVGAITAFSKVVAKQPRLADAYAYRAIAENECENYASALNDANIALKLQ